MDGFFSLFPLFINANWMGIRGCDKKNIHGYGSIDENYWGVNVIALISTSFFLPHSIVACKLQQRF